MLKIRVNMRSFFFFFTLVTGLSGSLSLKLSDARVYELHHGSATRYAAREGSTITGWAAVDTSFFAFL